MREKKYKEPTKTLNKREKSGDNKIKQRKKIK